MVNRWASRPVGTSAGSFLAAVRSEIPVALIATPRVDLMCQRQDRWEEIAEGPDFADFDHVPITDEHGVEIVAVFVRGTGLVALRENMFMASDAPLISFLESADQQSFRLLLEDCKVSGLVTLSDVQKLPVYSVLFSLLVAVEMLLMDWIRAACGLKEDQWLDFLRSGQRSAIERHWNEAVKQNLGIDRLSCATFGQEIDAANGLGLFKDSEGRRKGLEALATLRNKVCHAAEFAPTPELALTIPGQIRNAHALAAWLQAQIEMFSA
jgi:hypothetical protein